MDSECHNLLSTDDRIFIYFCHDFNIFGSYLMASWALFLRNMHGVTSSLFMNSCMLDTTWLPGPPRFDWYLVQSLIKKPDMFSSHLSSWCSHLALLPSLIPVGIFKHGLEKFWERKNGEFKTCHPHLHFCNIEMYIFTSMFYFFKHLIFQKELLSPLSPAQL